LIMDAFSTMGLLAWKSRHYEAARDAYCRASSYLAVDAIQNTESAGVLYNNIGMLLISENRVEEAGPYLEKALEIQSQAPMRNRKDLGARYLNNYGMLLRLRGDLKGAREYLEAALSSRTALLSDESADTATTVHELGLVLLAEGKLADAENWLRRSLETRTAVLGREHEDTIRSARDLSECLIRRGEQAKLSGG